MKYLEKRLFAAGLLLLLIVICAAANAGDLINGSVTPGSGTPNSIYNFTCQWQDNDNSPAYGVPRTVTATYTPDYDTKQCTGENIPGALPTDPPIASKIYVSEDDWPAGWEVYHIWVRTSATLDDYAAYFDLSKGIGGRQTIPDPNKPGKNLYVIYLTQALPTPVQPTYRVDLRLKYDPFAVPPVQGNGNVLYIEKWPAIGSDSGIIEQLMIPTSGTASQDMISEVSSYNPETGEIILKSSIVDVSKFQTWGRGVSVTYSLTRTPVEGGESAVVQSLVNGQGLAIYLKQTPAEVIREVTNASTGEIYDVNTQASDLTIGRVVLDDAAGLVAGTLVNVQYYVGPIELLVFGETHYMGHIQGSIRDGAYFRVRLSAGLNLANVANGVPGVVYSAAMNSALIRKHYMRAWDVPLGGGAARLIQKAFDGPPVYSSNTAYPGVIEEVDVDPTKIITQVAVTRNIDLVRGVFDDISLTKANYFTGAAQPTGTTIQLATALPQGTAKVWVAYTPSGSAGRYGYGGSGGDYLWWKSGDARSNPLWPELDPEHPAPDYWNYQDSTYVEPQPYDPIRINSGTSSTAFVFKVRYNGSAPQNWLPSAASPQGDWAPPTGVVLFLDALGTGDYKPYFMNKTRINDVDSTEYEFRIEPAAKWDTYHTGINPVETPYWTRSNLYQSLQLGRYHYFFACCDDWIKDEYGALYPNEEVAVSDPNGWWTQIHGPAYYKGDRRGYSGSYTNDLNYADIVAQVPGDDTGYPLSGNTRPLVYPKLSAPVDTSETKFLATLDPLYLMRSPSFYWPRHGQGANTHVHNLPGMGHMYSSGGTSATAFTFKVKYASKDPDSGIGMKPTYVKIFINNASDYGTAAQRANLSDAHYYRSYAMQVIPGQPQPYNWADGVVYYYSSTLAQGPHTYYFEAADNERKVHFPVRPDGRLLTNAAGDSTAWYEDLDVPGAVDKANDNDYIPGPYVNLAPVISNVSLTPSSGAQGVNFRFYATYSDPDNQRPYYIDCLIETRDGGTEENGGVVRGQMRKVDVNNSNYVNGVQYYLDLSSLVNVVLQPGIRHFKIEACDDWGEIQDVSEKVKGEIVYYPIGGKNWVSGPVVTWAEGPTLTNGSVNGDAASTTATLWNYSVTYTDNGNKPPSYVNVFIGKRDPVLDQHTMERVRPVGAGTIRLSSLPVSAVAGVWDNADGSGTNYYANGGTLNNSTGTVFLGQLLPDATRDVYVTYTSTPVIWDSGHQMTQQDPTDTLFTDGVVYEFSTRLSGAEDAGEAPTSYYYAFEASDGTLCAVYNAADSGSAGSVMDQPEPFIDLNHNGVWDTGEVYRDANGNGVWNPGPEPFVDTNGNGQWDLGEPYTDIVGPGNHAGMYDTGGEVLTPNGDYTVYSSVHKPLAGPLPVVEPAPKGLVTETRVFVNGQRKMPDGYYSTTITPRPDRLTIDIGMAPTRIVAVNGSSPATSVVDYYNATQNINQPSWFEKSKGLIHLSKAMPAEVSAVVYYYKENDYSIDYMTGDIQFHTARNQSDLVTSDYWFAQKNPLDVGHNTAPELTAGAVAPPLGDSQTNFVYSVTYSDTDGLQGQAPYYVRVFIDGVAFDMTSTAIGVPDYSKGIVYSYTTKLNGGSHQYHFEASDGVAVAVFDAVGSFSSDDANTFNHDIVDIDGPVINDPQVLTLTSPSPAALPKIIIGQPVLYTVIYTDKEGDAPKAGYPVVWIDDPTETLISGTVSPGGVTASTITDTGRPPWTLNQLLGKILQFTSGAAKGKTEIITQNTSDTITVGDSTLLTDGVAPGDSYQISGLIMRQRIPSETAYNPRMLQVPNVTSTTQVKVSNDTVSGVLGVFLAADPTGFNYLTTGPGGFYDFNTGIITLGTALPANTTTVYVYYGTGYEVWIPTLFEGTHQYHFSAISTVANRDVSVRLPVISATPTEFTGPVVIVQAPSGNRPPTLDPRNNSGVSIPVVTPTHGTTTTNFLFRIRYRDMDGNPPGYHDGVIGYCRLVIDLASGTQRIIDLVPSAQQTVDYQAGVVMESGMINLPAGTQKFHFEASDGWVVTRYPVDPKVDPTVVVNTKPVLSNATVTPTAGNRGTLFRYSVTYTDADNQAPSSIFVRIDGQDSPDYQITKWVGTPNYRTGATGYVDIPGTKLPAPVIGNHSCQFFAVDSSLDNEAATPTAVLNQPVVNNEEHFEDPAVSPPAGDVSQTFTYTVKYWGPAIPTSVKVIIDGVEQTTAMTKDANDNNPSDGLAYTYSAKLSTSGNHTYTFKAMPGSITYVPAMSGPTIASSLSVTPSDNQVSVGSFVDLHIAMVPARVATIDMTVTQPDGAISTEQLTTNSQGAATYSGLAMSMSGEWNIQVHWDGDAINDPMDADCKVTVLAPTHTVTNAKYDMVCPPVHAVSGDPADLFGRYPNNDPAGALIANSLHICRWSPSEGVYHVYGSDPTFPTLGPGQAFWIRPTKFWTGTSSTYSLMPFGEMVDQTQPRNLVLDRGWNQFGSVYMENINWSDVQVKYGDAVMSLAAAAKAGYIRDYAWGYDGTQYFLVHATNTTAGTRRVIEPWIGYWIRVLTPCELILPSPSGDTIPPPPGPNSKSVSSVRIESIQPQAVLDSPPPAP